MDVEAKLPSRYSVTRWLIPLLAVVAIAVFIRLGFWQLDRLAQRRAYNAEVSSRISMSPVDVNTITLPSDPTQLNYRSAVATGQYDYSHQVALGGQVFNGQVGVHLLTPLRLTGSNEVILVDRGWIPEVDINRSSWEKYSQQGTVSLSGRLMVPVNTALRLSLPPNQSGPADIVPSINLAYIGQQAGSNLLPVYLIAAPQAGSTGPQASLSPVDLTDGPHLSYAIQWFTFAAGLAIGYPVYLIFRKRKKNA